MEKEIDIRSRLSEVVHKTDPSAELYLFGSRARNTNRPDSDWDLLTLVHRYAFAMTLVVKSSLGGTGKECLNRQATFKFTISSSAPLLMASLPF
jgi:tRNA nucleotidyltransferase (CCA-adding enzyme)